MWGRWLLLQPPRPLWFVGVSHGSMEPVAKLPVAPRFMQLPLLSTMPREIIDACLPVESLFGAALGETVKSGDASDTPGTTPDDGRTAFFCIFGSAVLFGAGCELAATEGPMGPESACLGRACRTSTCTSPLRTVDGMGSEGEKLCREEAACCPAFSGETDDETKPDFSELPRLINALFSELTSPFFSSSFLPLDRAWWPISRFSGITMGGLESPGLMHQTRLTAEL